MKINWKVRLRSGAFWMGAISAALVFLYALANLFGWALPFAQEEIWNVVVLGLTLLSVLGVISDPTTPGMQDSKRAMGYDRPGHTKEDAV